MYTPCTSTLLYDMREIWAVLTRHLILRLLFFLPEKRRITLERHLRGKEEYRKLRLADVVLMSWGKSGRTWLRVMLSGVYQQLHDFPQHQLLNFDNFHKMNPSIPRVLFSHNNYLRDYLQDSDTLSHFQGKKVILLTRDPRDIAVSQFFQWKYRMRPHKKQLNQYPPHNKDISIFDFVTDTKAGIPRIIAFFNLWAHELPVHNDILVIRYEDMRKQPKETMKNVLAFIGAAANDNTIKQAVDFASYDNMKKLENNRFFRFSGARVKPGDRNNPDSYKVRRGKVGGYHDYFNDEQLALIDAMIEEQLDPVFGYCSGGHIQKQASCS